MLNDKVKSFFDTVDALEKERDNTIGQPHKEVYDLKKQVANITNTLKETQAT